MPIANPCSSAPLSFPCHLSCCWAKLWAWFCCTESKGQGQEAHFSSCCFCKHSSSFNSCTQQPLLLCCWSRCCGNSVLAQAALHFKLGHHLSWYAVPVRVPEGVGLPIMVLRQTGGVVLFSIPTWFSLQLCSTGCTWTEGKWMKSMQLSQSRLV